MKYAERRAMFRKTMEQKRKDAMSQFAHMRKLALLKANLVTNRLLVSFEDIYCLCMNFDNTFS